MQNKQRLDKNTYGDSKAETDLVKIINKLDNKKISSYSGKLLTNTTNKINSIECKDIGTKKFLYLLLRKYFFDLIDKSKQFQNHQEIKSYMKNCITKRLRKIL